MTNHQVAFAALVVAAALIANEARKAGGNLGVPALAVSALVAGTAYAVKTAR